MTDLADFDLYAYAKMFPNSSGKKFVTREKVSESPAPAAYARTPASQGDGCAARNGIPLSRDKIPSPTFLAFPGSLAVLESVLFVNRADGIGGIERKAARARGERVGR